MKLEQALAELADIVVNNETQKADVLNILHLNNCYLGINWAGQTYPCRIGLYEDGQYSISKCWSENFACLYPSIPAADFIRSNTPEETTNQNIPSPESANVL